MAGAERVDLMGWRKARAQQRAVLVHERDMLLKSSEEE
jgi:hypothetical protein